MSLTLHNRQSNKVYSTNLINTMEQNKVVKMSEIDTSKITSNQIILATENLSYGVVINKEVGIFNSTDLKASISQDNFDNSTAIVLKHLGSTADELIPLTDEECKKVLELVVKYMVWRNGKSDESVKDGPTEFKNNEKWITDFLKELPSELIVTMVAVADSLEMKNLINHILMQKVANDLKHLEKDVNYSKIPDNVLAEAIKYLRMDRYPDIKSEDSQMDMESVTNKSSSSQSSSSPSS